MNDEYSTNNIDSLLFQCALQTRELSQKKNEINQQIKGFRADIAERRSYIETAHRNIHQLEEDIKVKQSTLKHYKANAKSMKASNSLLRQYEQTLKEELESRKVSYNHDKEVYEERIASYRKIFRSHKEYYCQNPLAQKLLTLQAEKEEIESRIKACDDEITVKQKELDHFTAVSSPTEEPPESCSDQQPIKDPEKYLEPHTEGDSDSSVDLSFLHINQTKMTQDGHKTSEVANTEEIHEENHVTDTTAAILFPGDANNGLWSHQNLNEQMWKDGTYTTEQDRETGQEDQVLEQQSNVTDIGEEVLQEEMDESVAVEKEQASRREDNKGLTALPQSSFQGTNPQSSPEAGKTLPSTPTFPFNHSPGDSPQRGNSRTKSPAFPFSLNSDPSAPGFAGFVFDEGSSNDEDSSFMFSGSFFNKKKSTESKPSSCPEFLFDQQEQSEIFKFAFTSKSPQTTNRENTEDDFPFSFSF